MRGFFVNRGYLFVIRLRHVLLNAMTGKEIAVVIGMAWRVDIVFDANKVLKN
jgi:hypothetical protein